MLGGPQWPIFHFDFSGVDKQKLCNVLPHLIQLPAWSDSCCNVLSQLYSAHGRGSQKPSDRAMMECLKKKAHGRGAGTFLQYYGCA